MFEGEDLVHKSNNSAQLRTPAMVAEWSKTLVQIQVAISPLRTQVQILLEAL